MCKSDKLKIGMSIDKQQQSMENWKKQIIIDQHLNALFDSQMSAEQFLQSKILSLPHEEIVKVYMKLTSLKHSITKNMQKEIEIRQNNIENSFGECLKSKGVYESIDQDKIKDNLKQLQKFNEKYEFISERVTELKNINNILHFAKALEKFKVNVRLLKSMMKDFNQVSNSHFQSELLNTLKVSKIIKELSTITVKFDFSGIKSFEQERVFVNNTKGAIFGLVQKQLTTAFGKLSRREQAKRDDLEKDIISKFVILNNINKLKDFCIPFYKNTLKEMSELLKKSLIIGQTADQKDPKTFLIIFEEYFANSVNRRIIENSVIFIACDQLLGKSNIKTPFNFNFFEKYWENITGFMKDLIHWSIDNQTKQWTKQKLVQNIYDSFQILETKGVLNRYISSILWKYPILYQALTTISNEVHIYLIKYSEINHYDFGAMKQKFIHSLLPLAQLYYKHTNNFYQDWTRKITRINAKYLTLEATKEDTFPSALVSQLFDEQKNAKNSENMPQFLSIIDWLTSEIKTKQIYEFHVNSVLDIIQVYYKNSEETMKRFDSQIHRKQNFMKLIQRFDDHVLQLRTKIKFTNPQMNGKGDEKTLNVSSSQKLIAIMKKLKKYRLFSEESKSKLI